MPDLISTSKSYQDQAVEANFATSCCKIAGGPQRPASELCAEPGGAALRDIGKPLGISEFKHLEKLPEQLKGTLPAIDEIEAELARADEPS